MKSQPDTQDRCTIAGSVSNIAIIGHIFAIEENPGFHERYMTASDKRVLVISDMRKGVKLFIDGSRVNTITTTTMVTIA
jgi:hypothetical protein